MWQTKRRTPENYAGLDGYANQPKAHVRRRNDGVWRRLEKNSFIVFVDNLPSSTTKSWLWQIFQFHGEVVDIFMSWKKRKHSNSPFAFVRFSKLIEAQVVINDLHETITRGV